MEDYQKQVIKEKAELDLKIVGLVRFMFSNDLQVGGEEEEDLDRLEQQMYSMIEYSRALRDRISKFV